MAERIKGITVQIGGDTVGLEKALKGVNKTSRDLQSELKDVQKLLKFDPNNAELLAQKQKLLNDQITNSTNKLNQLKAAESQVQAQFDKGDLKGEQYRAFQRELQDAEQSLRYFQGALQDTANVQDNTKQSTQQLQNLFSATGKSVQDYADILGNRLVRAIQNGTASSKDLQNAFDKVGRDAIGAKGDVQKLKQQIDKLQEGQSSIQQVRKEIQKLGQDSDDAKESVKGIGDSLGGLALGAAAGVGGIGGIINKSLEKSTLDTKIEVSMEVPEESKQTVKDAISTIETYGQDSETALEAVRRQWAINGDATDAVNKKIVESAGVIARSYDGIDLTELIQESSEFGSEIGISQQQALDMQNALLKMGFPPEQLDIMSEYGGQLKRAGYSAEEIQGVFAAGIKTKSWNIDVLLDGLKEGRIGLAAMGTGVDDATAKIIQGTGISKQQLQSWGQDVAAGGKQGKDAMMEVALSLSKIENPAKRNEVGIKLFGTLWEEQGKKITDTLLTAKENQGDLTENHKKMNEAIATTNTDPLVQLQTAFSNMNTALAPVYDFITKLVAKVAEWVAKNPELAAGIAAAVIAFGLLLAAIAILVPIFTALGAAATFLNIGMLPLILIIGGIAIAVGLAIAAGIWLVKNWDTVQKKAGQLTKWIGQKFGEFKNVIGEKMSQAWTKIKEIWSKVTGFFKGIDLKSIGRDIIQGLINGIGSMASAVWKKAKSIATGIGDAIRKKMKAKSPSRVTMAIGEDTGEGLEIGLGNTMSKIKTMAKEMAKASIPKLPKQTIEPSVNNATGKALTVNIHSPKALDVRESNKLFQRTLNNMSLLW